MVIKTPLTNLDIFVLILNSPPTYPHASPSVTFINPNRYVRYHPNLYKNGKVCLSLLGTWEGPQWTSCQTLKSVLVSIQSILDEYPMRNEPSFEKLHANNQKNVHYNQIITYYSLLSGCIMQTTTPCCKEFSTIIIDDFLKNKTLHDNTFTIGLKNIILSTSLALLPNHIISTIVSYLQTTATIHVSIIQTCRNHQ